MKTYQDIINQFQSVANYHTYIQSFGHGNLDNLNNIINQPWPIMWVRALESQGITSFGSRTLSFEVYILSIPKQTDTDLIQVLSDTERVSYDIYTYFYDGQDQYDYTVTMQSIIPLNEAFQDRMAGWVSRLDFQTSTAGLSYCNIPTR